MTARRLALAAAGIVVPDELGEAGTVPVDDVLDAAAAAWTADRIGRGEAISVPEAAERDDRGKPMAIWR
jgi:predicted RNase H-like nuclease